jgi:hypothetical protein
VWVLLTTLVSFAGSAVRAGAQEPDGTSADPADTELVCEGVESGEGGAEVGSTLQAGPIEVTVTKTRFESTIDDFWDEGYLVADFTLTNTGDEHVEYSGYHDWSLLDLQPGGISPSVLDSTAANSDALLEPGDRLDGHITFPVGFAGGDLRIRFERDGFWGSDDQAFWALDLEPQQADPGTVTDTYLPTVAPGVEHIADYDVAIVVNDDGSTSFTETIIYDFGTYQRHGIYRDLTLRQHCNDRYDRVYPLHDVTVESETAPDQYKIEDLPDGKRIKIGDPDSTITGEHTYVVRYTLDGTLNGFPDHDELYWNVIGDGWTVQINDIDVAVQTPGDVTRVACYAGETGSRAACAKAGIGPRGGAVFEQPYLYGLQGLSVVVAFPPGLVPEPAAVLDERWALDRAFSLTPLTVGGAAALMVMCLGGWGMLTFAVGRDRQAVGSPTDVAFATDPTGGTPVPLFDDAVTPVEFVPPDNIRPAQLALLLHEKVGANDISATIVDLAVRGYLRIDENGKDYRLVRLRPDATGLLDYEAKLFDALVPPHLPYKDLSDHEDTFATTFNAVISDVYDDGMGRSWYRRRPDHARTAWRSFGCLGFLVACGLLAVAVVFTHEALLAVPLVVGSLLLFFSAGKMPARTPVGTGLTRRAQGFEIFLRDSEAPRARWAEQRNIFSEYLPYAIALGCADRWAKTFEPLGTEATAGAHWYVGSHPFSTSDFATSSSAFASEARSTLTSTPASSGSSGFSGGGGGGFSGGGGGGGGGGSW